MFKTVIYILSVLVVLALALSWFLQPNDLVKCFKITGSPSNEVGCQKADAIIVVSGGDTNSRVAHAVSLYENGWSEYLIFSGAAQDKSGPSNAEAMRMYAINLGVDPNQVIIEEYSHNTQENAQNTQQLLEYYNIKDVILVTSGYHQRRASIEFSKATQDIGTQIRNSPTSDQSWNWYWWATPKGWYLAISEAAKSIVLMLGSDRQ